MNDVELTREAIIAWLKQQPETRTMGSSANYGCDCLVGCYLRDHGYPQAEVGYGEFWETGNRFDTPTPLPVEVAQMIRRFDHIHGYDHTPSEVLRAVEEDEG